MAASHGLFTADSMELINTTAALKEVVVTDSLPAPKGAVSDKITRVGIAPMLAEIIQAEYFRWEKDSDSDRHGMQQGSE